MRELKINWVYKYYKAEFMEENKVKNVINIIKDMNNTQQNQVAMYLINNID